MKIRKEQIISPVLVLAVLAALAVETSLRATPADAEPYHARVRHAGELFPKTVGLWVGQDAVPDQGAQSLLRPNIILCRRYENRETGRTVSFLLVHCKDARDMNGHYPPVCYPGQGYSETSRTPGEFTVGDLKVPETEYGFSREGKNGELEERVIYNFMILPDGRIVRDMEGIRLTAKSYKKRIYGAGQIQILFSAEMPSEEREATVREFIGASKPLIETILSGVER
jgi:hypothetical protein